MWHASDEIFCQDRGQCWENWIYTYPKSINLNEHRINEIFVYQWMIYLLSHHIIMKVLNILLDSCMERGGIEYLMALLEEYLIQAPVH